MTQAVGRFAIFVLTLCLVVPLLTFTPAHAVQPQEVLENKELEARARKLSLGLRCLVCQNQSIDDSDAPLARDLRLLVRERLVAGDSDQAVIDYVVARYGDFVLLKPPLKPSTILLWMAPILLLGGGILLARMVFHRSALPADDDRLQASPPLSDTEQAKLDVLLNDASVPPTKPDSSS